MIKKSRLQRDLTFQKERAQRGIQNKFGLAQHRITSKSEREKELILPKNSAMGRGIYG
jgi:hypothetical protein